MAIVLGLSLIHGSRPKEGMERDELVGQTEPDLQFFFGGRFDLILALLVLENAAFERHSYSQKSFGGDLVDLLGTN